MLCLAGIWNGSELQLLQSHTHEINWYLNSGVGKSHYTVFFSEQKVFYLNILMSFMDQLWCVSYCLWCVHSTVYIHQLMQYFILPQYRQIRYFAVFYSHTTKAATSSSKAGLLCNI